MTLTKDEYDVWTENAYAYIRDQVRQNAVAGIAGSEGVVQVEVGLPDLANLATILPDAPVVWITPMRDTPIREGGYLNHTLFLEVHVFSPVQRQPASAWADGQLRHRQLAGRVYNEVLHLRDSGRQTLDKTSSPTPLWQRLDPDTDIIQEGVESGDRALMHTVIPFNFSKSRAWITP